MKVSTMKGIYGVALAALVLFSCGKPLTKTQKGAGIGTAGGAAAGFPQLRFHEPLGRRGLYPTRR